MFEMETRKNILDRLKQYYTEIAGDKVNIIEGGFVWDTLSANSKEFEKAYAQVRSERGGRVSADENRQGVKFCGRF